MMFRFSVLLCLLVSAAASAQPIKTNGLICTASDGERTVTFVVPSPNFTLAPEQSIHPQLQPEFSARWSGFLRIERTGEFVIRANAKVFVAGQEVQNQTNRFEAGDLPFRVEFNRKPGGARLQMAWSSDFFRYEPVPVSAFSRIPSDEAAQVGIESERAISRGRELLEEYNCLACHQSDKTFFRPRIGPDLTGIGSRISEKWIYQWLENPRHYRTNAAMPVLLKTPQIRADVTAFLAGLETKDGLGQLSAAQDATTGGQLFQNIGCSSCHGEKSLSAVGSKMNARQLAHYLRDPLRADRSGRMPDLALSETEVGQLAALLGESKNDQFEQAIPVGDAKRGQQFFKIIGCANCHTLEFGGEKIKPAYVATRLEKVRPEMGCVAEKPPGFAPDYKLTAKDRDALNAFLRSPDVSHAPVQDVARTLKQFNCIACHEFNGPARNPLDGPHAPPPLTDAGNKLRRSWLDQVLNDHKRARPWLSLRMPHYGSDTLSQLPDGFAACSGAELGNGPDIAKTTVEQVSQGVRILGTDPGGLACISCHDYNGQAAGAEMRGPDLTEIFARTRADWLRRWLHDPTRIKPGTAMPGFFHGMRSQEADHKITQIVHALSAGKNMPMPAGLNENEETYHIRVEGEPVIFRGFFTDASPRSIAVGLPGGFSYCFDAESCYLRYGWAGEFIDARATWRNRGGLPPRILGERFYVAPDRFPLRFGLRGPIAPPKFLGYHLTNGTPQFRFEMDGVLVQQRISTHGSKPGLVQSFDIRNAPAAIYFYAASGLVVTVDSQPVAAVPDGWVMIGERQHANFEVFIPAKDFPALPKPNSGSQDH